jgi:hypothetical protein
LREVIFKKNADIEDEEEHEYEGIPHLSSHSSLSSFSIFNPQRETRNSQHDSPQPVTRNPNHGAEK